jgi:hypothetical protein
MKTSSDFLWQLVQSLSQGEKLYFKRNFTSTASGKKLYLKLFDAVAAQKKYNEETLLEKFSPLITRRNIASQKHYLQKMIGEALLHYDTRDSVTHGIYNDILLIRVYRKKGLLDEANAIWRKAVLKARKTESFALLNLLKSEFAKMVLFSSSQSRYDDLHSLFKGNIITYNEYSEMIVLRDIYTETLLLKRKAHFDIDENLKNRIRGLLEIVKQSDNEQPAQSFWFRHYLRMNKATLLYLLNEMPQSLILLQEAWEDWNRHPQYLQSDSEYYIELLYMINYVGILNGSYTYVEDIFHDRINEMVGHAHRANFEAIKYLALNKIYNKMARYNEVEKLIAFMKQKYKLWESVLNSDLNRTLNLSLGISSFVLGQYSDALYFSKRGLTYFKDGSREEHGSVAHILSLLITYSMNDSRLFDAQYRSAYSYFHKRQKKHPFETALVQCLHRTFYMKEHKQKKEYYERTLALLEKSKDDKVQQMAFSIFNYPGWLSSRIQRIPYREYVQKQVAGLKTEMA